MMNIAAYIKELDRQYRAGNATEHTYRPALQTLLTNLLAGVDVTNEPRRIACGAPDFVLTRDNIPLGYIEAKDLGKNLDDNAFKEQLDRCKKSLNTLIFTDYMAFRLIRDGEQISVETIAELSGGHVKPKKKNFADFQNMLDAFVGYQDQTITTADDLARRMALKARMFAGVIAAALQQDAAKSDGVDGVNSQLQNHLSAFQTYLVHDITPPEFADIYAQTIAYGMFAARLHDPTPQTFSREEAAELIPGSNPFLRSLFQNIAGVDLDDRIRWIVDDLADIFRAADVGELMKDYGKSTQRNDPFIHFYETFLGEYDPKLRKSRGVYYTPEPVVNFIVRAVDGLLQTEFGLPQGLADTRKTVIEIDQRQQKVHKVQILDPAAGTGTFLADIVKHIHENYFINQRRIWPDYVKEHLIPRLNGFELLMASYAMAHTKLEMVLRETGCELGQERLRVFLTNSLEEHHPDTGTLFAQWLAAESREANRIKRDTPVMVVVGNPPYAVSSSNKGEWIQGLIADYKKGLNERKLNLDDDYIKFIRYGEHLVEKTGEGILAYISNNSFLDGITHRQMRKHLLETFDKIYILNLHGDARKKETAPDGSPDKNVFDIQQGVSINLFVKTGKHKSSLADVFHFDLYGHKEAKYDFLWDHNLGEVQYGIIDAQAPYYFFTPKDFSNQEEYEKGFKMNELCVEFNSGVKTDRDSLFIDINFTDVAARIKKLLSGSFDDYFKNKYRVKDSGSYKLTKVIARKIYNDKNICPIQYRPFDYRWIYYDPAIISRPGEKAIKHISAGENCALLTSRSFPGTIFNSIFISQRISDIHAASDQTYLFPLYLYPETNQQTIDNQQPRKPNLNADIVRAIADRLGLRFTPEKETAENAFAPIDLLDYIYAVLHSPAYRARYQEFLKIDFPRVPYPSDQKLFWRLADLGSRLRALHLLESPTLDTLITTCPNTGDNIIAKPQYDITDPEKRLGNVRINPTQHFGGVPETAWRFRIGGYQPAQKWLKDRKGRPLPPDDIIHYQKIIVALCETERLMREIDTTCPNLAP